MINIPKQDLIALVSEASKNAAQDAIDQTLKELGIRTESMWISQNKAHKIVGRKRLESAIKKGTVRYRKPDMDNPRGRGYINKKDVQKLINNPL
jgi:hypothetical protein